MKKWILALFVVGIFAIYIVYQRMQPVTALGHIISDDDDDRRVIIQPKPSTSSPSPATNSSTPGFKDGSYTGTVADAYFGPMQVKAIIQNGKLTDVQFLQYPNDRSTSVEINTQAMPILKTEAIKAQSSNVDILSGATQSSEGFKETLKSALAQAK